jgi:hypothetical protein
MTAAMEAAKRGRAEQLARWERYMAGQPVEFIDHQGKGQDEPVTYDPTIFDKPRQKPIRVRTRRGD